MQKQTPLQKTNLRIGIDGTRLEAPFTGIAKYVHEICHELDKLNLPITFFIYSRASIDLPFSSAFINRTEKKPLLRKLPRSLWLKTRLTHYTRQDKIDVFWASSSIFPNFGNNTTVLNTIYDLNHIYYPETMPFITRISHQLWLEKDAKRANYLITISKGTADKILKHFGQKDTLIIPPAISKQFKPIEKNVVNGFLQKYNITSPYLLSVSTLEPRKNLPKLIKAFLNLKAQNHLQEYHLLIVGLQGWSNNKEFQKLIDSDNSIRVLGYIPDGDLPSLYSGAELFVFPSLYEGFGIPVLEARACGTRIVASDIPEIREAGGENAFYIDPTRQEKIEKGILKALEEPRPTISNNFYKKHCWKNSAEKIAELFNRISSAAS